MSGGKLRGVENVGCWFLGKLDIVCVASLHCVVDVVWVLYILLDIKKNMFIYIYVFFFRG